MITANVRRRRRRRRPPHTLDRRARCRRPSCVERGAFCTVFFVRSTVAASCAFYRSRRIRWLLFITLSSPNPADEGQYEDRVALLRDRRRIPERHLRRVLHR